MDVLSTLKNTVVSLVSTKAHLRAMKKEDVEDILKQNISQHSLMVEAFTVGKDKEINDWFRDKVAPGMKKSKNSCKDSYYVFRKALTGKAATLESKRVLSSLAAANQKYSDVLNEILKGIDKLMEEENVTIYDVRISQLAVLGILKQSDKLSEYSAYLYSYMTRAANGNLENIPRNRDVFLDQNSASVATIVNNVLNNSGTYSFMKEVENIKKNQSDVTIGADKSFNFNGFVHVNGFSPSILDNIGSALSSLNIFGAALDAWDDYKLSRYERDKELREWMATHVAILKMDLANTDPNDPKYLELQNIIKAYDDKIAEYDRKIEEFEKGD